MASIRLDRATVRFPVFTPRSRSFRVAVMAGRLGGVIDGNEVEALRDITLRLSDGDRLGIVGPNGAGKTTLLRLMSGIYPPTNGSVKIEGRVSAITDLFMGMDLEASGFENIITRAVFLGLSHSEAKALVPAIAEFTELGEFLDLPIRTYSQGMLVRLGFAIITAIEPDILIMDEMIGAGDAAFIEKARQRTLDYIGKAKILILASHADAIIRDFCNRAVYLEGGRVVAEGGVDEVLTSYIDAR